MVIFTDATIETALTINEYCRSKGILFILAGILGPFGHVFVDFCDTFEVHDKDGKSGMRIVPWLIITDCRGGGKRNRDQGYN